MASLKEVRIRIKSVSSTQQITRAMKMVAAAKLRRAQDAITQMRPYAQRLGGILKNLSQGNDVAADSPYYQKRAVKKAAVLVVTSDRGLCGAFNTNVAKAAMAKITEQFDDLRKTGDLTIYPFGKKGFEFFSRRGFNVDDSYVGVFTQLSFDYVKEAAEKLMTDFKNGDVDEVWLVFNEFKNVATQIIRTEQFLPVSPAESQEAGGTTTDYIFEPSQKEIVESLIPNSIKIQLYRAILESNASEHGARMTAMDKATDNAGEMLKSLKLVYNQTRQAAITKEILEIVGGAEALK